MTTMGMMVTGSALQVASAIMPGFKTCASILKPAMSPHPASDGMRIPAGRINGLTMSPLRSVNCSTTPSMCA